MGRSGRSRAPFSYGQTSFGTQIGKRIGKRIGKQFGRPANVKF